MTDDDELWTLLRAGAAPADLDDPTAAAIRRRAHERLRNPRPVLTTALRTSEVLVVTFAAIAQLAWAWRVVLG